MQYDERICTECGARFTPRDYRQLACCRACTRKRNKRLAKERYRRERAKGPQNPKEPMKNPAAPTDWEAITRFCWENHISYGEAVRKGLL